ncbi:MAG: GNAT family N-acetyltransferase [Pirellulaceae bacterium]
MPASVRVEATCTRDPFRGIETGWDRLAGGTPFCQLDWYRNWWEHYGSPNASRILTVWREDDCIGIVPFYVQAAAPWGRILRLMGSGDICSDHQSILCSPEDAQVVGVAVANWLVDSVCRTASDKLQANSIQARTKECWNLIELDGLNPRDSAFAAAIDQLGKNHFVVHDRSTLHTWRIDLPDSMESYLSMLSKPCRRKVRSALQRFADGECRACYAESEADFLRSWDRLVDLHQRRRNSLGESGCFARPKFKESLFATAKAFHEADRLDFVTVLIGDRPVAAELCFRGSRTTYAYQIGIDPDALKDNPGWLVNTASIARAIELGQTGFDLCRGDAAYKHHLGARPTTCRSLRLVPPRLRSQAWDAAWCTGSALKRWYQTSIAKEAVV